MSNEKETKVATKLMPGKFTVDADSKRVVHFALVPVGTTIAQLKDPEFWAHIAASLRVRSRIEVEPEDGSFFAEFYVRSVGPNWARVELLREYKFISAETLIEKVKGFKTEWGGPAHKWRVRRESDNEVMEKGFDTPEQAAEWLAGKREALGV